MSFLMTRNAFDEFLNYLKNSRTKNNANQLKRRYATNYYEIVWLH